MVLFSPTSRGWGEKKGGGLWGCQGSGQTLDTLGAARYQAEGVPGVHAPAWGPPELSPSQGFPLFCLPR